MIRRNLFTVVTLFLTVPALVVLVWVVFLMVRMYDVQNTNELFQLNS